MCECLSTLSTGSGGKEKNNRGTCLLRLSVGMSESASLPRVSILCFSAEWDRYRCGFLLKPLFVFVVLYVSYITLDWLCNLSDNKRHIHNADYEWLLFFSLVSLPCVHLSAYATLLWFFFFFFVIVSDCSSVSIVAGVWASQRIHVLCMRAKGGAR